MSGSHFLTVLRRAALGIFVLANAHLWAARNEILWHHIHLPAAGTADQTLYLSAAVTNRGDAWGGNHYLELRDQHDAQLNYLSLGRTAAGGSRTATFALTLPVTAGTYTYHFRALEHGAEYFGPSLKRTIVVRDPLEITLAIQDAEIVMGESATIRSTAGPDERLA